MFAKTTHQITFLFSALFMSFICCSATVLANDNITSASPYVALETTGTKLFQRISDNRQALQQFPDAMRVIIEEELMPMIDHQYAAYKILGTNLRNTTGEQRKNFVASMRQYLVSTYATALNSYNDQQVIFEQDRNITNKNIVAVNTKVIAANKPDINLTFMMRKNKKTQQWKVYDMVVEGISLLNTKKSELNQRIAKRGLDQVTLELASMSK